MEVEHCGLEFDKHPVDDVKTGHELLFNGVSVVMLLLLVDPSSSRRTTLIRVNFSDLIL